MRFWKWHLAALAVTKVAMIALAGPAAAIEVDLALPVVSQYVWRGWIIDPEPSFQPSLTVSALGFSVNLWGSLDLTDHNGHRDEFTEMDTTVEYGRAFGPLTAAAGADYCVFPGIAPFTSEFYGRLAFDIPGHPSLAVYTALTRTRGFYYLLGLDQTFLPEVWKPLQGITVGLTAGYGSGFYNRSSYALDADAPLDLVASLSLPVSLPGGLTFAPAAHWTYLMSPGIRAAVGYTQVMVYSLGLERSW
jgi:hypothetical protein